ncbi:exodeoxyribonuclease V subunit alpha [Piscinibacter sakaiensis]|uniref:RecBCD enzyme subunit RecD n=1 Tax=Piscinibacter sakaiensis TaxID=1547922 RepID=A0A0K8NZ80_PISS1|nr:exodeoxyribonuclease V subunit alpha [Piscinibacter sakaiensis]GAP35230.1 exodeoxyribonuclease V, alpha chain [Piscinibacter sakaiensis]
MPDARTPPARPLPPPGPAAAARTGPATATQALAEGLAERLTRWAEDLGASAADAALAGRAGRALSLATSEGHVCLDLDELAEPGRDGAAWRRALLASGTVGTPEDPGARPLVLDEDGRLYLHRDHALERRLAEALARRAFAPPLVTAAAPAAHDLSTAPLSTAPDWQAVAAAMALRNRLTVVSGGPGTGKTTAVVRLLGLLLTREPDARIALAAPTGKAAARMAEALRQRAHTLPPAIREKLPRQASTLHRLLGLRPAGRGGPGGPRPSTVAPLSVDLLVIDEASMLDLALAARVLDALPPDARLVLLGDQDQLAAVESGAVFAELSADPRLSPAGRAALAAACGLAPQALQPPGARAPGVLRDCVVWFDRNHRFAADSPIGRLARQIRVGDAVGALDSLGVRLLGPAPDVRPAEPVAAGPGPAAPTGDRLGAASAGSGPAGAAHAATADPARQALHWRDDDGPSLAPVHLAELAQGFAPYLGAVRAALRPASDAGAAALDAEALLRAFDQRRVLCALRVGPRGATALDRWLDARARAALVPRGTAFARDAADGRGAPAGDDGMAGAWYPGRPVMVLRNDPLLGLFNGDIGIAWPMARPADAARQAAAGDAPADEGPPAYAVWFADPEAGVRAVPTVRLPEHTGAWALTIHQSQGSEFDAVDVVLPPGPHRVLTRELLYTAVTRARHAVRLFGSAEAVDRAVQSPTRRRSGLRARLQAWARAHGHGG